MEPTTTEVQEFAQLQITAAREVESARGKILAEIRSGNHSREMDNKKVFLSSIIQLNNAAVKAVQSLQDIITAREVHMDEMYNDLKEERASHKRTRHHLQQAELRLKFEQHSA